MSTDKKSARKEAGKTPAPASSDPRKRASPRPSTSIVVATSGPIFFKSPAEFRDWLNKHHAIDSELLLGFYNKKSGLPGITYAEALDEALSLGWIDAVRKNLDTQRYTIRFTPRRAGSIWSLVNVKHVERLIAAGRMAASGLKAFEARKAHKTGIYSFELEEADFSPLLEQKFRADKNAWTFWQAQPPGYRRTLKHWVMRVKRGETRVRRLQVLLDASAKGLRLR